jgi:hypothetical protein
MLTSLPDRIRHSASLSCSDTNHSMIVAYDHNGTERKATTTLDYFGYTFDIEYALIEFFAVGISWFTSFSHSSLQLVAVTCR